MPWRRPGPTAEPGTVDLIGVGARAPRPGAGRRRWPLAVFLLLVAACAKEEPPPGADPDRTPPSIREVQPADGSVVPDFDGHLRIRFDEPVEELRGLARRLEASPVGPYTVDFGFGEISVRPEERWRRGAVYHFRFPGGVRDLLGNEREEPFEVTFSTGPPITDTRVEGRIVDRIDRRPQQRARVLFLAREGDSIPYSAVADTGGRFELRSLPPGAYRAYAFRDLNGNRSLERRLEPWDSATFRLPDPSSTAELKLSILEPDTTPPLLALAEATDSVAVELTFDEHLDPSQDLDRRQVTLTDDAGDTVAVAALGLTRAAAGLGPEEAGPDEGEAAPADTAAAPDSVAEPAPGDTAVSEADSVSRDREARSDTLPLPSRTLMVRTGPALEDSVRYQVRVRGVRNLQGLEGGGDTTFVYVSAPDTAAARDSAARPDTAGARPDTAATDDPPADTTDRVAPADTAPPPDTAAAEAARRREGAR